MNANTTPSVTAVIVTWNSIKDIASCLKALERQTHQADAVIVVDNNSSDGTPELIARDFNEVKLILRSKNEGFAKGNNIAISECDSDWVLLLNPDAFPEDNYIETLIEFAADKVRIGMLTGKLLRMDKNADGRNIIDSTGIEIFASRRVRDRGAGMIDDGSWDAPERVFGACAAAGLYRTKMIRDITPDDEIFAEQFFSYYEDADLAWRAWRRGWQAWYVPNAECRHRRGGSPVGSPFSRYLTHRNRLWLIARNEPFHRLLRHLPAVILHEILMLLRIIRYPILLKAVGEALLGLPIAIRYRKSLTDSNSEPPPFTPGTGFKNYELRIKN
ncbi:MAG: glycosyltransferase family 2 protein [Calditrichaeota bacterium]|nr:glycosyltransferase family 2 protein [Calditrichota bacterium]